MGKTSAATGRPIPKLITSPIRKTSGQTKPAVPDSQSVSICANLWTNKTRCRRQPIRVNLCQSVDKQNPLSQTANPCQSVPICGQTKPAVADSQSVPICAICGKKRRVKPICGQQPKAVARQPICGNHLSVFLSLPLAIVLSCFRAISPSLHHSITLSRRLNSEQKIPAATEIFNESGASLPVA